MIKTHKADAAISVSQENSRYGLFHVASLSFILIMVGAVAFLAWNGQQRYERFKDFQSKLSETQARGAVSEMEILFSSRKRISRQMADVNAELISEIGQSPDDQALQTQLSASLMAIMPSLGSFALTNRNGDPIVQPFEGFVGSICKKDIQTHIASDLDRKISLHPNPSYYHYDIVTPVASTSDIILLTTFSTEDLVEVLSEHTLPGNKLYLVSQEHPLNIEIGSEGDARDLSRSSTIAEEEQPRLQVSIPVKYSAWNLVVITDAETFYTEYAAIVTESLLIILVMLIVGLIALSYYRRESVNRHRIEAKFQASLAEIQKLSQTVMYSPDATFISDLSLNIEYVNPAFVKMLVWDETPRVGQHLKKLIPCLFEADDIKSLQGVVNQGEKWERRQLVTGQDGTPSWVKIIVRRVDDEYGNPQSLLGQLIDITQQLQTDQSLSALAISTNDSGIDQFLENCVESLSQIYDSKYALIGTFTDATHSRVRTRAVWMDDALDEPWEFDIENTPCEDVVNFSLELIPKGASKLYPKSESIQRMNVDGYFGTPLLGSDGNVIGVLVIMDTKPMQLNPLVQPLLGVFSTRIAMELERSYAEEALFESERRYSDLFDSANDLIQVIDASGKFLYVNYAWKTALGYDEEELESMSFFEDIFYAGEMKNPANELDFVKYNQKSGRFQIQLKCKDGSLLTVEGDCVADYSDQGVSSMRSIFQDVTEKLQLQTEAKHQQVQLIQANKMSTVGTLVASVAHEINNPNNLILLNAPLMEKAWGDLCEVVADRGEEMDEQSIAGLPFKDAKQLFLQISSDIESSAKRIQNIVSNLVDFSRPQRETQNKVVSLNVAVKSALALIDHTVKQKAERFYVDLDADLPEIVGNLQALEQIVVNLVMNALEALPSRDCAIWVATGWNPKNDWIELRVHDKGAGIDPDIMDSLTEAFITTKQDHGGSGLGLAITEGLVKQHNGEMTFTSTPGKDTIVSVRFPIHTVSSHTLGKASGE